MVLALASAVKGKRKRRYNPNFRAIRVNASLSLGTLAQFAMGIGNLVGSADGQYRVVSADLTWSISGLTVGEGPLAFGLNHSDYSTTEAKEWFDSAASISKGNKVLNEQRRRKCRQSGTFSGALAAEVINDGKPIRTKFSMQSPIGTLVEFWVHNGGSASPLTTGATVRVAGKLYIIDY